MGPLAQFCRPQQSKPLSSAVYDDEYLDMAMLRPQGDVGIPLNLVSPPDFT